MTKFLDELEKNCGAKIERSDARVVPGTEKVDGLETVYFSDDGKSKFSKQFDNLTASVSPRSAKSGGRNDRGCSITIPEGLTFYAIGYHGDLEGWRKDIETGAHGLGLLLAHIENDRFVISDGRSFALSECVIKFT